MTDRWIGVNPLSWMNSDIPSLGENISVEQCLSEISLIGYQGVELEDKMRKALIERPSLLEERELCLVGGWHSTFILENDIQTEAERLEEHLDFLQKHGAEIAILADCSDSIHRKEDTPLSERPRMNDNEWDRCCQGLEFLAQIVKNRGMRSAYHHHMGTTIQNGEDIDRLMENTEDLGLLFDVGHLVYAETSPEEVLDKHFKRITHVHLKNIRQHKLRTALGEDFSFIQAILDGVFTVPGDDGPNEDDGVVFYPLIRALVDGEYKGWIIMEAEQNPNVAHPLTYASLGQQAMNYWLSRAELASAASASAD